MQDQKEVYQKKKCGTESCWQPQVWEVNTEEFFSAVWEIRSGAYTPLPITTWVTLTVKPWATAAVAITFDSSTTTATAAVPSGSCAASTALHGGAKETTPSRESHNSSAPLSPSIVFSSAPLYLELK